MTLRGMLLGLRNAVKSESGLPVDILSSPFFSVSVNHISFFLWNPLSNFLILKQNKMVGEGNAVQLWPSKEWLNLFSFPKKKTGGRRGHVGSVLSHRTWDGVM